MEGGDMLIDLLPEHLVSYILSHLPTDEAIGTSILSKRWRNLWTTITHLDLDEHLVNRTFYGEDRNFAVSYTSGGPRKNFGKYVNTIMLRLKPSSSIDKLSVTLTHFTDVLCNKGWISSAIERSVKDLTLEVRNYNPIVEPLILFQFKSLEALRLGSGLHLKFLEQGFVCFQNLKSLSLKFARISGIAADENSPCFPKLENLLLKFARYEEKDDCVMKLIRNCPLLKDLSIERCLDPNVSNNDMCVPQLTTLNLHCDTGDRTRIGFSQIEAPIKYLNISQWNLTADKIIITNPDCLIGARLSFSGLYKYDFQGVQHDELLRLFRTLDKVKYLTLSSSAINAIKISNIRLPLFVNLVHLEVELECEDFSMLECLLHSTVNLRSFVKKTAPYASVEKPCTGENGLWSELSHVPKCLISSLKRVEISRSFNCYTKLQMIRYILNSAKVLEKFICMNCGTESERNYLCRKISAFPRSSASCRLDFIS